MPAEIKQHPTEKTTRRKNSNMETANTDAGTEIEDESATDMLNADGEEGFSRVTAVVTQWTVDFLFLSMCRHFKQRKLDEFSDTLATLDAITPSRKEVDEKMMICAFVARVMHGQELDVQFEDDSSVMPLMSAARIWSDLEDKVADDSLHKNISLLLLVQSVAVCMEKGQMSSASAVLKWFESNLGFPQRNVGVMLTKIVTQKDPYHPFLVSNNFSRLLQAVQFYLDTFLKKNPCDYLLKAATKVAQHSPEVEVTGDTATLESSLPEPAEESRVVRKTKRKLMSTEKTGIWSPALCKKPGSVEPERSDSPKRCKSSRALNLVPAELCLKSNGSGTTDTAVTKKGPRSRQKWSYQMDKYLKEGVRRHGTGKWGRILKDYDFEGRTGTMLKDRWRVLLKADKVS